GIAIHIDEKAIPGENSGFVITNNNIDGNGYQRDHEGLVVDAGTYSGTLDARNNWWGSGSGPAGDGPGSGDAIFANDNDVLFSPWATAKIGTSGQPSSPPAAPSSLAASATSPTSINLSWRDNATTESGFRIERSTDKV